MHSLTVTTLSCGTVNEKSLSLSARAKCSG
jgi:hypothetical protein